jgi:threonylcarbamoyladenosine tRNA methylthiotransferase MtaB
MDVNINSEMNDNTDDNANNEKSDSMNNGSVAYYTLGCKVNTSETEGMRCLFEAAGFLTVPWEEHADVYIINTCTVTNMSDRKSRQMIRKAQQMNKNAIIAVVGCYVQVSPDAVAAMEGIDVILGNNMKHLVVERVKIVLESKKFKDHSQVSLFHHDPHVDILSRNSMKDFEELTIQNHSGHGRAFLKIQDGCNQFCSYCIIPYARGPLRSRAIADVVAEAHRFASQGFMEVVLTGIHLSSFTDDNGDEGIITLINEIEKIEGIERIRLGSLEPIFMTDKFIEFLCNNEKVCKHFHLSLQSGSGNILRRMNRKYTPDNFREIVRKIRDRVPDVSLTSDLMVGFPGETEQEFQESFEFCKDVAFSWMHIFPYSPRKGTPAAKFENQIHGDVKTRRASAMIELACKTRAEYHNKFLNSKELIDGKPYKEAIVGKPCKEPIVGKINDEKIQTLEGYTNNYLQVRFEGDHNLIGKKVNIRLISVCGEYLQAVQMDDL